MTPISTRALHQLLDQSASRFPDKVAVDETEIGSISYAELARLSDRVRNRLRQMSVKPGDRVGICLRKSADAVASCSGRSDSACLAKRIYFCNCAVKAPPDFRVSNGTD